MLAARNRVGNKQGLNSIGEKGNFGKGTLFLVLGIVVSAAIGITVVNFGVKNLKQSSVVRENVVKHQLDEYKILADSTTDENARLLELIENLTNTVNELENYNEDCKERIISSEQKIDEFKATEKLLESEKGLLKATVSKFEFEIEALKIQKIHLEETVAAQSSRLEEFTSVKTMSQSCIIERDQTRNMLTASQQNTESLKLQLVSLEEKEVNFKAACERNLTEIQLKYEEEKEAFRLLEEDKSSLHEEVKKLAVGAQDCAADTAESQNRIVALEASLTELEKSKAFTLQDLSILNAAKEECLQSLLKLEGRLQSSNEHATSAESDADRLARELETCRASQDESRCSNNHLIDEEVKSAGGTGLDGVD